MLRGYTPKEAFDFMVQLSRAPNIKPHRIARPLVEMTNTVGQARYRLLIERGRVAPCQVLAHV